MAERARSAPARGGRGVNMPRPLAGGLLVLVCWALLSVGAPASANHAPVGAGGCTDHTVACYPNCRWEWTGQTGSLTNPPTDTGYCPVWTENQTVGVSGTVAVSGDVGVLGTVPVSGTVDVGSAVEVVNPSGQRLNVTAICETTEPCVAGGGEEVWLAGFTGDGQTQVNALGVAVGLGVGALVGGIIYRRPVDRMIR